MSHKIIYILIICTFLGCGRAENSYLENKYTSAYVEQSFSKEYIKSLLENNNDLISEKDLIKELGCNTSVILDSIEVNNERIFVSSCKRDKRTIITYLNKDSTMLLAINSIHIDITKIYFLQGDSYDKLIDGIIGHDKFVLNMK